MITIVWFAFVALAAFAAYTDARTYRIPNQISVALTILFFVVAPAGLGVDQMWIHIAAGAGILALGYVLFQLTGMGGGDAKLAASIGLWAGPSALLPWINNLAIFMLALAIVLIIARRLAPMLAGKPVRQFQRGAPVPLGIALSLSAIVTTPGFDSGLWLF